MSKIAKRNFPVQGLGCAACVAHVQNALRGVRGVSRADVSLASNMASVEYDAEACTPGELREAVRNAGYDLVVDGDEDDADSDSDSLHEISYRKLKKDTWTAVVLAGTLMLLCMAFKDFPYKGYVLWALATPVVFVCGGRFFSAAWRQLRHGRSNMDTLVALSVTISYLFSVFNLLFPQVWTSRGLEAHLYFESSATIVAFILLGRLLEEKAKHGTTDSIRKLRGLQPSTVTVRRSSCDGTVNEMRIPAKSVIKGDTVVVKPGERVPVDGTVTAGESYVDESMLTGEPVAELKTAGAKVFSGTVNQKGSFDVLAEKTGSDTVLSSIIRMVRDAQGSKAPIQNLVDKVAAVFVPAIIVTALSAFLCWVIFSSENGLTHGLLAMVTVLVIACPCSLGLATPTAVIAGIGKGAECGILIKDAGSLEVAGKVDAVVLDKTGTVTEGHPEVVDSVWDCGYSSPEDGPDLRSVLYSLELKSEHPLAEAIVNSLRGAERMEVDSFESITGMGIKGCVNGTEYYAGSPDLLRSTLEDGIPAASSPAVVQSMNAWLKEGNTVTLLFNEKRLYAVIAIADRIKATSRPAVMTLRRMGIEVHMLTGDDRVTAEKVASEAGIVSVKANMLPQDKAMFVKELQDAGKCVAMVGDGINDSAALAQADLGISMGKGSDIAMDSSMVTIVSSDLEKIPEMARLSKRTVRIIRQNLFWAFIYNVLAVPVAAGVLYPFNGFLLNPMIAAACMAMSSVCVVSNSLRLRR